MVTYPPKRRGRHPVGSWWPSWSPRPERVGASGAFSPGRRSRRRGGYPPLPRKAQLRELAGPAVMHGVVCPLAEPDEIPRLPRPARIILRRVHMMHHRGCRRHGRISRSLPAALVPPKDPFPQPLPSVAFVVHPCLRAKEKSQHQRSPFCGKDH